jgi:hypothetical protein
MPVEFDSVDSVELNWGGNKYILLPGHHNKPAARRQKLLQSKEDILDAMLLAEPQRNRGLIPGRGMRFFSTELTLILWPTQPPT